MSTAHPKATLRSRLFGATPSIQSKKSTAPISKRPTIADRFKAEVERELPECTPVKKQHHSPARGSQSIILRPPLGRLLIQREHERRHRKQQQLKQQQLLHKRQNTSKDGTTPTNASHAQVDFALHSQGYSQMRLTTIGCRLKDAYAERCQTLHQTAETMLERIHAELQNQLRAQSTDIKESVQRAHAAVDVANKMAAEALSRTLVRVGNPVSSGDGTDDGTKQSVLLGHLVEEFRMESSKWGPALAKLESQLNEATKNVESAGRDLVTFDGEPGKIMAEAIENAKARIAALQKSATEKASKLAKDTDKKIRDYERTAKNKLDLIDREIRAKADRIWEMSEDDDEDGNE